MENKDSFSDFSGLSLEELFRIILHAMSGSGEDHKIKRVRGLEEFQRRIKSDTIMDLEGSISLLLEMAKQQGRSQPESALVIDSLEHLIDRHGNAFSIVLNMLRGQGQEEDLLFLVFSGLVLRLDYEKKRQAIPSLARFLMTRDAVSRNGVNEVYNCLLSLGNQTMSKEVVKEVSPHLHSLTQCTIVYSVRLCSKFADHRLLPKMLDVLDKCMKGYFDGYSSEIERDVCGFLERIRDEGALYPLLNLLKSRFNQSPSSISDAIGAILDANPSRVDEVLDVLHDTSNENLVDAILRSFEKMEKATIDPRKLLSKIRINWWDRHPTNIIVQQLIVKGGESSKPALFDILKDERKYAFALRCLQEIGVLNEELLSLFEKPVMLRVYTFLCSLIQGKSFPKDLNQLLLDVKKLRDKAPPSTWQEHLILNIFTGFNFATLNVAPLNIEAVDLVCFQPETLHLFIVGCTTGTIKDDLAKIDALMSRMEEEASSLFDTCKVVPIVVSTETASIFPSDEKYAYEQGIVILQRDDIRKLLEMLTTNRKVKEVIDYIDMCGLRGA